MLIKRQIIEYQLLKIYTTVIGLLCFIQFIIPSNSETDDTLMHNLFKPTGTLKKYYSKKIIHSGRILSSN